MKERLNSEELSRRLGVRPPLLMLDRLDVDAEAGRAEGLKLVSMDECHFVGHFPGQPVMPGVLQVGLMCQSSVALFQAGGKSVSGEVPVVTGVRRVKFRVPVRPGMRLESECVRGEEQPDGSVEYTVKNLADGQLASSGMVTVASRPAEAWYAESAEADGVSALPAEVSSGSHLEVSELMGRLPHRYPFLLVDRAYELADVREVWGLKNVTCGGTYAMAVTPSEFAGYLQVECGAQLGCAALLSRPENAGKLAFFMSIDAATFHAPVHPGEQLVMCMRSDVKGRYGMAEGRLYVGSRLVTEMTIKFAIVSQEEAAGGK